MIFLRMPPERMLTKRNDENETALIAPSTRLRTKFY